MLKLTNIDNIVKLEYGNWISWYSKTLLSYEIINDEILKVSVRLTPAFSVGSCSVAASPTSNFITIM